MKFLHSHLGMGDMLVINGLIRELAQRDSILLPVKERNMPSVKWMFSDLQNVFLLPVGNETGDEDARRFARNSTLDKLPLGLHANDPQFDIDKWDYEMYRHAGVPFEERWSAFKTPDPVNQLQVYPRQKFMHEDVARGFRINHDHISYTPSQDYIVSATPKDRPTIFAYMDVIREAHEVHCIDSCFLILADSIPTKGHLFFHKYARPGGRPPKLKKNWKVLE